MDDFGIQEPTSAPEGQAPTLDSIVGQRFKGARPSAPVSQEASKVSVDPFFEERVAKSRQISEVKTSVNSSIRLNPDEYARYVRLSRQTGLDPDLIMDDGVARDEAERRQKLGAIDFDSIVSTNPKTAKFLSDKQNAGVAHDDTESLSALEIAYETVNNAWRVARGTVAGALPKTASDLYGLAAAPFGIAHQIIEQPISSWAEYSRQALESNPISTFPLRAAASIADMNMFGKVEQGLLAFGEKSRDAQQILSGRTGDESVVQSASISAGESLGSFGAAVLGSARRGGLRAGSEASIKLTDDLGKLVFGSSYFDARKAGNEQDPLRAAFFAQLQSKIEMITEKVPVGILLKNDVFKKNLVKNFVNFQVKEGIGEQVATGMQGFTEWALLNNDKPLGAYLAQIPNAALETAIATTIAGGGQVAAVKIADRFSDNGVQDTRAFFDALSKGVSDSKLHKRLPEKTREFIAQLKEDGDVKNVYIEAEQFNRYFQSQGIDPAKAATELLGPEGAKQLTDATVLSGDVVIPLETYAEKIAASEHHKGLQDDLRLRQGDLSFRQDKIEKEKPVDEVDLRTLTESAMNAAQEEVAVKPIYDSVYTQALAVGVPPSQADTWASIESARYRTRAARLGVAPMDLWNREGGLTVAREGVQLNDGAAMATFNQSQVNAPEFKTWFDGSEVVDEGGQPLVVYHGTGNEFNEFSLAKSGDTTGGVNTDLGFFFTNKPAVAGIYARMSTYANRAKEVMKSGQPPSSIEASGQNIIPAYLAIKNPLRLSAKNLSDADTMMKAQIGPEHDGAIVDLENGQQVYMVRDHNQIMSSISKVLMQKERGMVQIGDGFRQITLLKDADPSTFIHELGHTWLEELKRDATTEGAPQQLVDDWATVSEWLGLESATAIPVEAHEKFARGTEAYFMEGTSPSNSMRRVFAKVKAWMVSVYKQLTALDVRLNKDVREVFDRLIAMDEEIDRARALNGYVQMFTTPADAGMTEAEFKAYSTAGEDLVRDGREKLTQSVADDLRKEQAAEWRANRKTVKDEVTAKAHSDKTYKAIWLLSRGENIGGAKVDSPIKLNKDALVAAVGEDKVKALTPAMLKTAGWVYTTDGGVHPDFAAKALGFKNGQALVDAIIAKAPMQTYIEEETNRIMAERFGDPMDPAQLAEKADEIVNSERQADLLSIELKALRKRQIEYENVDRVLTADERKQDRDGRRALSAPMPMAALKEVAFNELSGTVVEDLDPRKYLYAEARSAKKALELASKKDFAGAAVAKQQQILNLFLYSESVRVKKEVNGVIKHAYGLTKESSRKRIGKAGQEWLVQMDSILNRYGFATRNIVKQRSAGDWLKSVEDTTGEVIATSADVLNESADVNYKELTVDELRAVHDTLRSIEHVAKKITQIDRNGKAFEVSEITQELADSVHNNVASNPMPETDKALSQAAAVGKITSGFLNSNIRPEKLFERMDGAKQGVWHDLFWNPAVDAQNFRDDLRQLVMRPLVTLNQSMGNDQQARMNEGINIKSIDRTLSRRTLIGVALNVGNESNLRKLQEGGMWFGESFTKIDDTTLSEMLNNLSKSDWDMVQQIWDSVDLLFPYLNDLNMRAVGIPLERTNPTPVQTKFGNMRGGYWPAVADARHSKVGEQQERADTLITSVFGGRSPVAATSHSFRHERTGAVYPLQLDWERVLSTHVNKAITDIAYHEWVKQSRRLLEDQKVKKAIQNSFGDEIYRSLEEWLVHQVVPAHGGYSANQSVDTLANTLLSNTVVAALGFKAATAIGNFVVAPVQASHQMRPDYTVLGISKFLRNPIKAIGAVHAMSGEMRHRFEHYEQTFNIVMNQLEGKSTIRATVAKMAMAVHLYVDKVTSTALWTGKYQQEIDSGKSTEEAARLADKMIRTTQTAGAPKDLSSFERDPRYRWFKMFIGPMIIMQNEMRGSIAGKGAKALISPEVWGTMFATWIIPAVLFELAVGRGPAEDEEWWEWAMRKVVLYPAQTVPFVRDAASAAEAAVTGRESMARMNPISDSLISVVRAADKAMSENSDAGDVAKAMARVAGVLFGLPTGQAVTTVEYLGDVYSGEYEQEGIEDLRFLLYRRD